MSQRRLPTLIAVLVLGLATALSPGAAAAADALPLKRVLLSSGGVGYFEHEATVDGDTTLPLTVRLAQVDDVLKSLVVYDDRGGVGTVSLPGREPLAQLFRDLPFGPDALESPVTLLRALSGASIRVSGARTLEGRILGVTPEEVVLPGGLGRTIRHRVSVIAPGQGVLQFVLEEADRVELVDPKLAADLTGALEAVSRHRVQDRRTLMISLRGPGRRTVKVGYVVEAPLWKTSYRLTVPDAGAAPGDRGHLQGWAVVENMSGQGWRDVEVTLGSGNPVTFRQALYTTYYVPRPEAPVEVPGRVLPRVDAGSLQAEVRDRPMMASPAAPAPAVGGLAAARAPAVPPGRAEAAGVAALAAPVFATATEEAATQVLFRVPGTISLETGHSLVIPIVDRGVPVQRLALYDPQASPTHPLAAVRMTNDGASGLPPGALTLYERSAQGAGAYVGDARLAALPAGDNRLLSFAVDHKVQVSREPASRELVRGAKVSRGTLVLTVVDEQTTRYRLRGPAQEERVVLIEHPRVPDWRLIAPPESEAELTRTHYRVRRALARGEAAVVEVTVERPRASSVAIGGLSHDSLIRYARTGGLPEPVRRAFETLATLQAEVDREERAIAELETGRKTIHGEQERIRANLGSVPGGDLRQRYLDRLKQQEDQLDVLAARTQEARGRLAGARERLADAIARLDL